MPSVSPPWIETTLLPQAASVRATAMAENRQNVFVEIRRIRRWILSGRDGRPAPAPTVLFEDRAQPPHRPGVLAAQPAAPAERLADLVREQLRLALEGERHARRPARARLERVGPQRPDPVVLAGPPRLDDQPR